MKYEFDPSVGSLTPDAHHPPQLESHSEAFWKLIRARREEETLTRAEVKMQPPGGAIGEKKQRRRQAERGQ